LDLEHSLLDTINVCIVRNRSSKMTFGSGPVRFF
jgi:hypothetical protein